MALIAAFRVSLAQVSNLRCTAEHLIPRSEGGGNDAANVVAACLFCNRTRHRARVPLAPRKYKTYVTNRMLRGRWLAGMLPSVMNSSREIAQYTDACATTEA